MNKHKFNIFPEAKKEDYERLRDDIKVNGYDSSQPITTYQGGILDGWNRLKACSELEIAPTFVKFEGSDIEAIAFVMRTNKRRNLNSGQWGTIAAEAEELMQVIAAAVEKERREKIAKSTEGNKRAATEKQTGQKIVPSESKAEDKTAHKVAEMFNTNRTYVNNAKKMKAAAPEVFEKVKAGTITMQDGMKAVRAIPTDPWSTTERERQAQVERGVTVVANAHSDKNLIAWAEADGKSFRVDRGTKFGNPFILNDDGTRDHVCDCYEHNYLPNKPSITGSIDDMKGKVLICHCYPLRCHGDALAALANGQKHKPKSDPKAEAKQLRKLADQLDPPDETSAIPKASELKSHVPDELPEAIDAALWQFVKLKQGYKDRKWRYQSVDQFAGDMKRLKNKLKALGEQKVERMLLDAFDKGWRHWDHDTTNGKANGNGNTESLADRVATKAARLKDIFG